MNHIFKYLILLLAYIFNHNKNSKIIYYHDVTRKYTNMGTELDVIKRHISLIEKQGFTIVPQITEKENQVMICFDDGWAGIYDAKDFFIGKKIFPTVFIAVGLIGRRGYLTLDQILDLQLAGFNFECHTWSHKDLTTFDKVGLKHEIVDSKYELSRILGKDVTAFCFPRGRFSDQVLAFCKEAGYKTIYSSIAGGYYDLLDNRNLVCRNLVQSVSDREFLYIINSTSRFFVNRTIKLHYQK